MSRTAVLASVLVAASLARSTPLRADSLERVRTLFARGEFSAARDELQRAYAVDPRPELLFALGQVELNLGNPQAAIGYYEQFLATAPAADQAALAQQAIGAARMKLANPVPAPPPLPPPPPPPRPRAWDTAGRGLVALGGALAIGGGALIVVGHHRAGDDSGRWSDYDDRRATAATTRWVGIGLASAGAVAVGVALVRYRLSGDRTTLIARPAREGLALHLDHRW